MGKSQSALSISELMQTYQNLYSYLLNARDSNANKRKRSSLGRGKSHGERERQRDRGKQSENVCLCVWGGDIKNIDHVIM